MTHLLKNIGPKLVQLSKPFPCHSDLSLTCATRGHHPMWFGSQSPWYSTLDASHSCFHTSLAEVTTLYPSPWAQFPAPALVFDLPVKPGPPAPAWDVPLGGSSGPTVVSGTYCGRDAALWEGLASSA